jgi:transposase InsO family protein
MTDDLVMRIVSLFIWDDEETKEAELKEFASSLVGKNEVERNTLFVEKIQDLNASGLRMTRRVGATKAPAPSPLSAPALPASNLDAQPPSSRASPPTTHAGAGEALVGISSSATAPALPLESVHDHTLESALNRNTTASTTPPHHASPGSLPGAVQSSEEAADGGDDPRRRAWGDIPPGPHPGAMAFSPIPPGPPGAGMTFADFGTSSVRYYPPQYGYVPQNTAAATPYYFPQAGGTPYYAPFPAATSIAAAGGGPLPTLPAPTTAPLPGPSAAGGGAAARPVPFYAKGRDAAVTGLQTTLGTHAAHIRPHSPDVSQQSAQANTALLMNTLAARWAAVKESRDRTEPYRQRVVAELSSPLPPGSATPVAYSSQLNGVPTVVYGTAQSPRLTELSCASVRSFFEGLLTFRRSSRVATEGLNFPAMIDSNIQLRVLSHVTEHTSPRPISLQASTLSWGEWVHALFDLVTPARPYLQALMEAAGKPPTDSDLWLTRADRSKGQPLFYWKRQQTESATFSSLYDILQHIDLFFDFLPASCGAYDGVMKLFWEYNCDKPLAKWSAHFRASLHVLKDGDANALRECLHTFAKLDPEISKGVVDVPPLPLLKADSAAAAAGQPKKSPPSQPPSRKQAHPAAAGGSTTHDQQTKTSTNTQTNTGTQQRPSRPPPATDPTCTVCYGWHSSASCYYAPGGRKPPEGRKIPDLAEAIRRNKQIVAERSGTGQPPAKGGARAVGGGGSGVNAVTTSPPSTTPAALEPHMHHATIGVTPCTVKHDTGAKFCVMGETVFEEIAAACKRHRVEYEVREVSETVSTAQNSLGSVHITKRATFDVSYCLRVKRPGEAMHTTYFHPDTIEFAILPSSSLILIGSDKIRDRLEGTLSASEKVSEAIKNPANDAFTVPHLGKMEVFADPTPALGAEGAIAAVDVISLPTADEDDAEGLPLEVTLLGVPSDNLPPLTAEGIASIVSPVAKSLGTAVATSLSSTLNKFWALQEPMDQASDLPTFTIDPIDPKLRFSDGMRKRYPAHIVPAFNETIDSLVKRGIVSIVDSPSELTHVNRVVCIVKADGRLRITIDLRRVNDNTILAPTYLPKVKDVPSAFVGCWMFSKLDLKDAFFQFPVDAATSNLLGFALPDGRYAKLLRAPQGASNVPGHVQKWLTDSILIPFARECSQYSVVEGMLDDIVIGTRSPDGTHPTPGSPAHARMVEAHLADLDLLLSLLAKYRVRVAPSFGKCEFLTSAAIALGFRFDGLTTGIDPSRTADLRALSVPPVPTVEFLRHCIGMFSYHRDAVNSIDYLAHLQRLHDLLARALAEKSLVKHLWTRDATTSVNFLRDSIINAVEQYTPDINKPLYVYTDASDTGWGVIAVQVHDGVERPVLVLARPFTKAQRDYKVGQKEAFAIVSFVRYMGAQLLHWDWTLRTDHKNLGKMSSSDDPLTRRWFLELLHVCRKIQHIAGDANICADALSRSLYARRPQAPPQPLPLPALVAAISVAVPAVEKGGPPVGSGNDTDTDTDTAVPSTDEDISSLTPNGMPVSTPNLLTRIAEAQTKTRFFSKKPDQYTTRSGGDGLSLIYVGQRLAIPPDATELIDHLLKAAHDGSAHGGVDRTEANLRPFWMANKSDIIHKYVSSCSTCQHAKSPQTTARTGTSTPMATSYPFERVIMDYQGPFIATPTGLQYVLTFTDCFTRYTWVRSSRDADSRTSTLALHWFVLNVARPTTIQTDPGSHFMGDFVSYCARANIKRHVTHAQHPQSNGIAERSHRSLLDQLRILTTPATDTTWAKHLPDAVNALNTSVNRSIGFTPHEVLYGVKPRGLIDASLDLTPPGEPLETRNERLAAFRELVGTSSASAAIVAKGHTDSLARPRPDYKKGDTVLVYYKQRDNKLHPHFRGPFEVISTDPKNPNFFIVGTPEPGKPPSSPQSLASDRLIPFNSSRTTTGAEEIRRLGPDHYVVESIVSHQPRVSHPGECDFLVKWQASGEISPAELDDLRHLPMFLTYCKEHGISMARIKTQLRNERVRARAAKSATKASSSSSSTESAAATTTTGASSAAAEPKKAPRSRASRSTEYAPSELDPAIVANAKFKTGDQVYVDTTLGTIVKVISTRGGVPWYDISFPSSPHKSSSTGYAEDTLTVPGPRRPKATAQAPGK